MDEFLSVNDNGTVNNSILWESFKAALRGKIISYEASKKERHKRLGEIEVLLSDAGKVYTSSLLTDYLYSIMKLKNEYNIILNVQVNKQILKLRQKQWQARKVVGETVTWFSGK